jgi:hypothetical protein
LISSSVWKLRGVNKTLLVNVIEERGKGVGTYRTGACSVTLIRIFPSIAKFRALLQKHYTTTFTMPLHAQPAPLPSNFPVPSGWCTC